MGMKNFDSSLIRFGNVMKKPFEIIAIIGKPRDQQAIQTHRELYQWLSAEGLSSVCWWQTRYYFRRYPQRTFSSLIELGKRADLAAHYLSVAAA